MTTYIKDYRTGQTMTVSTERPGTRTVGFAVGLVLAAQRDKGVEWGGK